ncbi:MAG TPA: HD domain-containing protein [Nitrosopumilaceae archaeon]|nr:HD domain-containing protein [Nitrosopumilaceae archaeon]
MLFDFFNIITELKKTPRKGWKDKAGIESPESVADHSFNMAIMAMVLSDLDGMGTEKILKMALLHDVAESITGDLTPDEISKEDKTKLEKQTMQEILTNLPSSLSEKYVAIWDEYVNGYSKEAVLVHDIDRLEMALQARKYLAEGKPLDKLDVFFSSARKDIKSEKILKLLDEISYK